MNEDKDTKLRLLESARKEFIEKGYNKASLRSICADAKVTTGALYFFYKDKDDLFEEVMKEPLAELYGVIKTHFISENESTELPDGMEGDIKAAEAIVKVLFKKRDLFLMMLTKAQGSKLENIRDEFVAFVESHYRSFAYQFEKIAGKKFVGDEIIHWISHDEVDVFVYLLEHYEKEEDAIKAIPSIVSFLTGGWYALFR
ncbi:MAG: helix-turn-helix transcriptional regulator [Clostridiales bacterium]|nr:helix-turn-helix transcriptional regulator [Clostridiales bacterium]